jgi:hypothetical protein
MAEKNENLKPSRSGICRPDFSTGPGGADDRQWLTAESDGAMELSRLGRLCSADAGAVPADLGFVGSDTARFSHFVRGPGTALDYVKALLRGETPLYLGHNPMGGWSIRGAADSAADSGGHRPVRQR